MENVLLILIPVIVIVIIGVLLYRGFQDKNRKSWADICVAIILVLVCCLSVVIAIMNDWGVIVFIQIIFASGAAILSGIALVLFLDQWNKLVGILMATGIPLALFGSLQLAFPYSPDQIIRNHGEEIAGKINSYHLDKGAYPDALDELVPNYLSELNEPGTIWGWLYTANKEDFTLGYVWYVDSIGYSICMINSASLQWECPMDHSTGPFILEPTPMP
jgi:hypothetical protein